MVRGDTNQGGELIIERLHYPKGTNGILRVAHNILCYTIELPWVNNVHLISCIPEGRYALAKRFSDHLGLHLQVMNVPNRELILIHPANNALLELEGCIAPVSSLTGQGTGDHSRAALKKIITLVYPLLEKGEPVFLNLVAAPLPANASQQSQKQNL